MQNSIAQRNEENVFKKIKCAKHSTHRCGRCRELKHTCVHWHTLERLLLMGIRVQCQYIGECSELGIIRCEIDEEHIQWAKGWCCSCIRYRIFMGILLAGDPASDQCVGGTMLLVFSVVVVVVAVVFERRLRSILSQCAQFTRYMLAILKHWCWWYSGHTNTFTPSAPLQWSVCTTHASIRLMIVLSLLLFVTIPPSLPYFHRYRPF